MKYLEFNWNFPFHFAYSSFQWNQYKHGVFYWPVSWRKKHRNDFPFLWTFYQLIVLILFVAIHMFMPCYEPRFHCRFGEFYDNSSVFTRRSVCAYRLSSKKKLTKNLHLVLLTIIAKMKSILFVYISLLNE